MSVLEWIRYYVIHAIAYAAYCEWLARDAKTGAAINACNRALEEYA